MPFSGGSGSGGTNLGVGTNDQVLTADSAESTGVKWANNFVELGYAQITSAVVQTGVGGADVPGLSITVTIGARPVMLEFGSGSIASSSASGITVATLREGGTTFAGCGATLTTVPWTGTRRVRLAPSAGSHTYKIFLTQLITGNGTITGTATEPTYITVVQV